MKDPQYLQRWLEHTSRANSSHRVLLEYLRTMNRVEWTDLFSDLILRPSLVSMLLHLPPGTSIDSQVAYVLEEVDPMTQRIAAAALTEILRDRLSGGDSAVLSRLFFLLSIVAQPDNVPWIWSLVNHEQYGLSTAVSAAMCLVDNDAVTLEAWEELASSEDAELSACALAALAFRSPERYFGALRRTRLSALSFATHEQALVVALQGHFCGSNGGAQLREYIASAPAPVRELVTLALQRADLQHLAKPAEVTAAQVSSAPDATPNLPPDLKRMLKAFQSNPEIPFGASKTSEWYLVASAPYAKFMADTDDFQQQVTDLLHKEIPAEARKRTNEDFSLLTSGAADSLPMICPFPFFLTSLRSKLWGVLPYGRQTTIGIIMSRQNPFLKRWREAGRYQRPQRDNVVSITGAKLEESDGGTIIQWLDNGKDKKETWKDMALLVDEAIRQNGKVNYEKEFIFEEVLLRCLRAIGDTQTVKYFTEKADPVEPARRSEAWWTKNVKSGKRLEGKKSLYIIDPAELTPETIHEDFCAVVVPHRLFLPVGIGFNAAMAPLLAKTDRWKPIWEEAWRLFKETPVAKNSERFGITAAESMDECRRLARVPWGGMVEGPETSDVLEGEMA